MMELESSKSAAHSVEMESRLPQKRYYRQRAHTNPIADHCFDYPPSPDHMDWSALYPFYFTKNEPENANTNQKRVEFVDIGCGYGGLLLTLAEMHPQTLCLGMEIRVKVCDYVQDKIRALRQQAEASNQLSAFQNAACLRMNAMKYLPNHFKKGQLQKMFFLFPDPHFKRQKHKWRIISQQLLSEYAYFLADNARVYFVTDVRQLYDWMDGHFDLHPMFERLSKEEMDQDPIVPKLFDSSEEGKKVTRNNGEKFFSVFRRLPNEPHE